MRQHNIIVQHLGLYQPVKVLYWSQLAFTDFWRQDWQYCWMDKYQNCQMENVYYLLNGIPQPWLTSYGYRRSQVFTVM